MGKSYNCAWVYQITIDIGLGDQPYDKAVKIIRETLEYWRNCIGDKPIDVLNWDQAEAGWLLEYDGGTNF
jgi:Iap family predicted aminopeptidase